MEQCKIWLDLDEILLSMQAVSHMIGRPDIIKPLNHRHELDDSALDTSMNNHDSR